MIVYKQPLLDLLVLLFKLLLLLLQPALEERQVDGATCISQVVRCNGIGHHFATSLLGWTERKVGTLDNFLFLHVIFLIRGIDMIVHPVPFSTVLPPEWAVGVVAHLSCRIREHEWARPSPKGVLRAEHATHFTAVAGQQVAPDGLAAFLAICEKYLL